MLQPNRAHSDPFLSSTNLGRYEYRQCQLWQEFRPDFHIRLRHYYDWFLYLTTCIPTSRMRTIAKIEFV